jgi:hypothetical protein
LAHRLTVRQQHSAPLVERIKAWALAQKALPDSTFRKALEYMLELWNGLTLFLLNPRVPLDNNHVERQMWDMVLGRKNHYGGKSQRGTEVAALFYSLIETARLRGDDPGDYLLRAALAAIENPGVRRTVTTAPAQPRGARRAAPTRADGARQETPSSPGQPGVTRPPISGKRSYARRSAARCAGLSRASGVSVSRTTHPPVAVRRA